jgi:hypothetical protein
MASPELRSARCNLLDLRLTRFAAITQAEVTASRGKATVSAEVARQIIVKVGGRNGGMSCGHRNLMQIRYDISDGV